MKRTIVLISTVLLFAGLTFGQTPQTQDKAKTTTTTTTTNKTEAAPAKDAKGGCDQKTMEKCAHSKEGKSCCAHDKKGEAKESKDTKAPEKK
jgi:hypothetical protein